VKEKLVVADFAPCN